MLVIKKTSSEASVIAFPRNSSFFKRAQNRIYNKIIQSEFNAYKFTRPTGQDLFSDNRSIYDIARHPLVKEADIIHLHWISFMVDYKNFFRKINKPIIWTLHDVNPFTGGCHYAGSCRKYESRCGACPQLGSKSANDLSRRIFERKKNAYKNGKIFIVSPSKWMADCAKKSTLLKDFKINDIAIGLRTAIFDKRNKRDSRDLLNIPQDRIIILFGSDYKTERKGFEYLIQALELIKKKIDTSNIGLAVFGPYANSLSDDMGFSVYPLGRIDDEELLSFCYSTSDLFIMPSLEESFGQTCLEAMSCGVPVVGFNAGGTAEMIVPLKTGLLAETKNTADLAEKIIWMIKHSAERQQMGVNARKLVERKYTIKTQAEQYRALYQSILDRYV
ncbi:MAG: glycosyltransferase family 4 protein [Candidatus Omnitrophica bacterium]|nr:glycosyltransferase family 4 protein [Candidatus Omnitrophota bacterium]